MATKRKKRINRSFFHKLYKQDKFYRELYQGAYSPNYKESINSLPRDRYISRIFFNPKFVMLWSIYNDASLDLCKQKLDVIYSNFNVEDIYIYLRLHYEMHKEKDEIKYFISLIDLINSLSEGYIDKFNGDFLLEKSYYVFGLTNYDKKNTINIARDFFYYNYSSADLRLKYNLNFEDYTRKIKEIYQNELLPIDISLQSY